MKKIVFFVSFLFLRIFLTANMGPQGFSAYMNTYFVETGTYKGDSIQKALDSGFPLVRSIEFIDLSYKDASKRFKGVDSVDIFLGDSSKDLWKVIEDLEEPITFWLDAHIFPPREDGGKNCPIIEELEQIKLHPIKTHTILIDDMHCCGQDAFDGLTQKDFIEKILEINSDYVISFVPGGDDGEYPVNVLVAQILTKTKEPKPKKAPRKKRLLRRLLQRN